MVPVRLSGEKERLTGARFGMLLETLSRHWADPAPLALTVVGLGGELAELRRLAGARANLTVSFLDERDLLSRPAILALPGWHKQMFIKLLFARVCAADAYLYLDADILCVRPLGRADMVRDGLALSDWEPKHVHPGWWTASRRLLGRAEATSDWGLSVTPNLLVREIALAVPDAVAAATGEDPIEALVAASGRGGDQCWVENCIYTEFGEMTGLLKLLHAPLGAARYHSPADLWGAKRLRTWAPEVALAGAPEARFMVVQSTIALEPDWIRQRLKLDQGGPLAKI